MSQSPANSSAGDESPNTEPEQKFVAYQAAAERERESKRESARPGLEDDEFRLERDLERLETSLRGLREQGSDVRLVVIDPIDAYLHAGRSSRAVVIPATDPADLPTKRPVRKPYGEIKMEYPPGSVRKRSRLEISQVVARLVALATRLHVAVVVVANSGSSRIDRNGVRSVSVGHEELATAARSVLMVARDLDQDQDQRRLILPLKLNVAAMQPGLSFSIQQGQWQWHDETVVTAEEYSRQAEDRRRSSHFQHESKELDRATDWVWQRLSEGSVASATLYAEALGERISQPTLRRALRALGCQTFRVGTDGHWEWQRRSEPPRK